MLVVTISPHSRIGKVPAFGYVALEGFVEEVSFGLPGLYDLDFAGISRISLLFQLFSNRKQLSQLHFYFRLGRFLPRQLKLRRHSMLALP